MSDRDPRTDPMRGDVLKRGRHVRMVSGPQDRRGVLYASVDGTLEYDSLRVWRQWAAEADVIYAESNP